MIAALRKFAEAWPAGLMTALAAIAIVESSIAGVGSGLAGRTPDWWLASEDVRRASACQVIGLGDSLIKGGLSPSTFEAASGLRAYNLALGGGQAPSSYFLLRRALRDGARPRAVVVDFSPRLLELGPRHNATVWHSLIGPAEALELATVARDPGLFGELGARLALPSYRSRQWARDAIAARLGGLPFGFDPIYHVLRIARAHGGQIEFSTPPRPWEALDALDRGFFPLAWRPDPTCDAYVGRFLALARDRGIRVYWLLPPVLGDLGRRSAASGFDARFDRYVKNYQAHYPNVTVIDARPSAYADGLFWDPLHLNPGGATRLSASLGPIVAAELGHPAVPGRWLRLPDPDPRSIEQLLADLKLDADGLATGSGGARR